MTHGNGRWFLPESSDVLERLAAQVEVTVRGIDAFAAWGGGEVAAGETVRASFTTPLEPEDLFDLSRGLDDVLNGAKNAVREAEALAMAPDAAMARMCEEVAEGVRHLGVALQALGEDPGTADTEAAAAIKAQRNLERTYRAAMSQVIEQDDLREILARQELYRRLTRISDAVVGVADRVMYATVREG